MAKKRILLKITGNTFTNDKGPFDSAVPASLRMSGGEGQSPLVVSEGQEARSQIHSPSELSSTLLRSLAQQIKQLSDYSFAIVAGAGNFFRGNQHGKKLGISESQAHQIGMLATGLNGLIIQDIFGQEGIATSILTAFECPSLGHVVSPHAINAIHGKSKILIFVGGTGNPYFSTDTAAVIRGLQIGADQIWKATNVDGIYDKDPNKDSSAQLIKEISYDDAFNNDLKIMDATAFALAREHKLPIRVFNIFEPDALINAANNADFGSIIK